MSNSAIITEMPPLWAQTIQIVTLVILLLYLLTRVVALPNVLR